MKDIVILGGPNGAGKTTAAKVLLPQKFGITEFVNADEIARGLSPFAPERANVAAGRIMLNRIKTLIRARQSFGFETTLAGRSYENLLRECRSQGWQLILVFLWLESPEMAQERVARRVLGGGHAIPPETIVRRYQAGLRNLLEIYLPLAEIAVIYDNADEGQKLILERTPDGEIVHDWARWAKILKVCNEPNEGA